MMAWQLATSTGVLRRDIAPEPEGKDRPVGVQMDARARPPPFHRETRGESFTIAAGCRGGFYGRRFGFASRLVADYPVTNDRAVSASLSVSRAASFGVSLVGRSAWMGDHTRALYARRPSLEDADPRAPHGQRAAHLTVAWRPVRFAAWRRALIIATSFLRRAYRSGADEGGQSKESEALDTSEDAMHMHTAERQVEAHDGQRRRAWVQIAPWMGDARWAAPWDVSGHGIPQRLAADGAIHGKSGSERVPPPTVFLDSRLIRTTA